MAKHIVKCLYCGESFDASQEAFIKPNSTRYAHKACAAKHEAEKSEEDKEKEALYSYIKQILNIDKLTPKIIKQLKQYIEEYKYTYSGIHRTLIYFYEIKGNDISKANEGIGIVPYAYTQAYRYYYDLWLAQQRNENKSLDAYKPKEIVITIPPPQRKIKRRKLFSFLDKETDN